MLSVTNSSSQILYEPGNNLFNESTNSTEIINTSKKEIINESTQKPEELLWDNFTEMRDYIMEGTYFSLFSEKEYPDLYKDLRACQNRLKDIDSPLSKSLLIGVTDKFIRHFGVLHKTVIPTENQIRKEFNNIDETLDILHNCLKDIEQLKEKTAPESTTKKYLKFALIGISLSLASLLVGAMVFALPFIAPCLISGSLLHMIGSGISTAAGFSGIAFSLYQAHKQYKINSHRDKWNEFDTILSKTYTHLNELRSQKMLKSVYDLGLKQSQGFQKVNEQNSSIEKQNAEMKTEISTLKEDVNTLTTDLTELKEKMDTLINQFNKSATSLDEQQNDSNSVKAFPLYRRHSF
ncbi:hypothetical protein [Candidatus Arsenophonus triatominarum]|uniref:hypothetical protein n=1 Tax=Candidatus Arsenophonus triatominarum TaxID=57911 RepID=UPI0007C56E75|nr:hypothetical protein [Candidatus Arsenophonus triatominarum]